MPWKKGDQAWLCTCCCVSGLDSVLCTVVLWEGTGQGPGSPACSPRRCSSNLRVSLFPSCCDPLLSSLFDSGSSVEQGCLLLAEPLEQGIGHVLSGHVL